MASQHKLKRAMGVFSAQFLYGVLVKSFRGSLLLFGGAMLLSSTSAWKFMESSFSAHDLVREAAWTKNSGSDVLVIGIDDTAFASFFGGTSPLQRDKLLTLLRTVYQSAPKAQRIVIDLDLAPTPNNDQSELQSFFSEQPKLWVIADPIRGVADDSEQARAWRDGLCRGGVLMGRPYLPTDFGYVNPRYQFEGSLSQVAITGKSACEKREGPFKQGGTQDERVALQRIAASMSPDYASAGFVLPFHGNLDELANLVTTINPKYIVLGGMWGTGDVLNTPFGDRYGVQLHGAAIDGAVKGYHAIPYAFNFLVLWISVALMTIMLSGIKDWIEHHLGPYATGLPGHQLLLQKIWPLIALVLIFATLIALAEVLAILFSLTRLQANTSVVATSILAYMVLVWNFGLGKISRQETAPATWNNLVVTPIEADISSLRHSLRLLFAGPEKNTELNAGLNYNLSKPRAGFEAVMSLLSLILQTVLPMLIMVQSIYKSF